jgi:hypothetical protein
MTVDAAGNVYVVGGYSDSVTLGSRNSAGYGRTDGFLAKYDTKGECKWIVQIGGKWDDLGTGVAVDEKGNSYMIGVFQDTATFGNGKCLAAGRTITEMFVAKYDSQGDCEWAVQSNSTHGFAMTQNNSIAVDPFGNVYVTGIFVGAARFADTTVDAGLMGGAVLIAKIYITGKPDWARQSISTSPGAGIDGIGIAVDPAGNTTITGAVSNSDISFDQFQFPYSKSVRTFVAKYDAKGSCTWAVANGGEGFSSGLGVSVDVRGNSYVTGEWSGQVNFGPWSRERTKDHRDVFISMYDPKGNCLWVKSNSNGGDALGRSVTRDGRGGMWLAGSYYDGFNFDGINFTGYGAFIAKLAEGVMSVDEPSHSLPVIPTAFELKQNYPNPFNPSTTISFSLPSRSFVSLKIFDVMGRGVGTIVNEELPAGTYTREWNAAGMTSGLYFYRMQAGNFTRTNKLLLLR